ncbi:hypothetical protein KBY66_07495 [Synechococcus sp. Tobar12-5m-g]|uniref:hypothetical protein n=1 Tax=unclassified Synechococcus TaxID=2626047 RepID=UPI0020CDCB00|nr:MULTISPECIES: hypothetical protein [unclassified Synechococcus]MCP9772469.1 hypothetical protein [Synechococcus sp. Tobar12-5m-g]MCP9874297.1 hypothetical protein [Synechococcus sp. Cruz CV-v-12]
MQVVLDASALLAFLRQKPGSEVVQQSLAAGVNVKLITAVTLALRAWTGLTLPLEIQLLR